MRLSLSKTRTPEDKAALVAAQDAEAGKAQATEHKARMASDPEYARLSNGRELAAARREVVRIENRLKTRIREAGSIGAEIERLAAAVAYAEAREPRRLGNLQTSLDGETFRRNELRRAIVADEAALTKARKDLATLEAAAEFLA